MRIHQAIRQEARELFALEQKLFSKDNFPISLRMFHYHLFKNICFVAIEQDKIIGYILLLKRKRWIKIYSLGVANEHRGKKVGSQLVAFALKFCTSKAYEKALLEVRTDNIKARALYKSFGFYVVQKSLGFYGDGCDALVMQKKLL